MRREEITTLKDKQLTCKICGDNFIFTVGEQEFFSDRGLAEPRRCPSCRKRRRDTIVPDNGVSYENG